VPPEAATGGNSGRGAPRERLVKRQCQRVRLSGDRRRQHRIWPTGFALVLLAAVAAPGVAAPRAAAADGNMHSFTYPSAAELSTTQPGDLLAVEPMEVTPALREASSRSIRIMYRSQGLHGTPAAVTGALMLPRGSAPSGGWPIVAWAHGTAGVGPDCAPSLHPNLYPSSYGRYQELAAGLLRKGFAVVATDYPDLGFPDRLHGYLQVDPERRSVIDSVMAARNAFPQLSRRWFAVGHSQGGQAVVGVAEQATSRAPSLDFLGTVAFAPGNGAAEGLDALSTPQFQAPFPGWADAAGYLLYQAISAHQFDPKRITYTDVISPQLAGYVPTAQRLCLDQLSSFLEHKASTVHRLTNPNWSSNQALQRFYALGEPSQRSSRPILLLQGTKDLSVSRLSTNRLDFELCQLGDRVEYRTYTGADHDVLLPRALPDAATWMRAILDGRQAPGNCQLAPPVSAEKLAGTGASRTALWAAGLGAAALALGVITVTLVRRSARR
jgi:alpha-beta hydrolase superfamily lysophospholipase